MRHDFLILSTAKVEEHKIHIPMILDQGVRAYNNILNICLVPGLMDTQN